MDTKKLNRWAELLLDTGKRNNLINFKDTKASTVEVLYPFSDAIFAKVDSEASLEIFDTSIYEEQNDEEDDSESTSSQSTKATKPVLRKEEILEKYAGKLKRKNQVILYNEANNPLAAVKNISKKARTFIEETGVNVVYMAFGFIHWKEKENSNLSYRAPILLVPIQLEQESAISPFQITFTGDDIVVNPTFSYKLEAEHGVKIPTYNDEGLKAYLDQIEEMVQKLKWTVTSDCKIGIFSFLKINMYRDLKDNASTILSNPNVRQLLGEPNNNMTKPYKIKLKENQMDPLIELHSVVDADSSQIEAIEMEKSGTSFVLQGPPGTGKSQTITNIIAECLSEGKKVLFVSEKLAALNVVYEKLKQAGLSEFCLELHSHKANKKDVITEICRTVRLERSAVSAKAETEIAIKKKEEKQLDDYVKELHQTQPVIDRSLYQLFDNYSTVHSMPDVEWAIPELTSKGEEYLVGSISDLEQYVDFIPSIGYDFRKNAWYGYINQDISYQTKMQLKNSITKVTKFLEHLVQIQQSITEQYGVRCETLKDVLEWRSFFEFLVSSKWVTPSLLHKESFDAVKEELDELQIRSIDIIETKASINTFYDDDIFKIDGATYNKELTKLYSSFFSRLFSSEYKNLIKEIYLCKKDGNRLNYAGAVEVTLHVSDYQKQLVDYQKVETPIKGFLGKAYKGVNTDWDYVTEQMDLLEEFYNKLPSFGLLSELNGFASEKVNFENYLNELTSTFSICSDSELDYIEKLFNNQTMDLQNNLSSSVLAKCTNCMSNIDGVDNWVHFINLYSRLESKQLIPFILDCIGQKIDSKYLVNTFKKQFYYQWICTIISGSPVLSAFNRISQDKAKNIFSEKDVEQFEINKAKIRAELSAKRPSPNMISTGSALAILMREGEKKRKQKSIRKLLTDTGDVVQRIKPCFLMSPLSVSTFLSQDSVHFDVVIFDEASQIFPQDAIGAIYRADQLIVVGDSKQMPPSNFFNASIESDIDDEEIEDVTDFESILDLCSTTMQQLRLRWHYRSRYEQLVSFSNKNFYDNDLVTFPSSKADSQWIGVDYYHVNGIFDRKSHTNVAEAEFIVDLIYENIEKYPDRSLGVVAFSISQQDLIDEMLAERRQATPDKEFFFAMDHKEPFFIKNLETVQGDERDTIIFSIAYGFDEEGRLLHNFGPLNRLGGERRLNVAITRAKYNVQLVSSMHYTDIDLKRTHSEGAKLLREYLDFAENGNIALERTMSSSPFEQLESDFEYEVCEFLKSNGFEVDTQVGYSGFRIDIAVKLPNSIDYALAIECDGATYSSSKNARDRDRLRQEVLERMGWKFYRIWSTEWFRNTAIEKQRLLETVKNALESPESNKDHTNSFKSADSELNKISEFEEVSTDYDYWFPRYKAADLDQCYSQQVPFDYLAFMKNILQVETPVSEDLLRYRIVSYLLDKHPHDYFANRFTLYSEDCERYDIIRRNGFLYLKNKEIQFRSPGDIKRSLDEIAPEELSLGMLEVLRLNGTSNKKSLYHSLALQCGISRVGKNASEIFDEILLSLEDSIVINGEQISVKRS